MLGNVLKSLPDAAKVTEQLVSRYSPEAVWQVERLGEHTFRAWLSDGGVVLATVLKNGMLAIKDLREGVC